MFARDGPRSGGGAIGHRPISCQPTASCTIAALIYLARAQTSEDAKPLDHQLDSSSKLFCLQGFECVLDCRASPAFALPLERGRPKLNPTGSRARKTRDLFRSDLGQLDSGGPHRWRPRHIQSSTRGVRHSRLLLRSRSGKQLPVGSRSPPQSCRRLLP